MRHLWITLFLISFLAQAGDEKLCEYLKHHSLDRLSQFSLPSNSSEELRDLIAKVSQNLNQIREKECRSGFLMAIKDFDTCSRECVNEGQSELRTKATLVTHGMIGLSSQVVHCQNLCKSYQAEAFAFEDGLKARENSPDCTGAISNGGRLNQKVDLIRKVNLNKKSSSSRQ